MEETLHTGAQDEMALQLYYLARKFPSSTFNILCTYQYADHPVITDALYRDTNLDTSHQRMLIDVDGTIHFVDFASPLEGVEDTSQAEPLNDLVNPFDFLGEAPELLVEPFQNEHIPSELSDKTPKALTEVFEHDNSANPTTLSAVKVGKMPVYAQGRDSSEALRYMIIYALSQSETKSLTIQGLQSAIEWHFPDYHGSPSTWMRSINELLHDYGFPTEPFLVGNRLNFKLLPGIKMGSQRFDPSPYHNGPFPLMKLPLRIRLMIYKHALVLPTHDGWIVDDTYTEKSGFLYKNRAPGESLQLRTRASKSWSLLSPPMQTWMALICVSWKVYCEAMPIFYGHNTFRFNSCATMRAFLAKLPKRRHFIGRVVLNYDPPLYQSQCTPAFKLLTETNLKYLKMEIHEIDVLTRGNGYGAVARLPGFFYLEKMRGVDQLAFSGVYDKTKHFLKKILRPTEGAQRIQDLEEREERKEIDLKANLRVVMKATMKEIIKEGKKAATAARKEATERRRRKERAKKRKAREIEKDKREEKKRQKMSEKEGERQAKREQKEAEKEARDAARQLQKEARARDKEEADAKKEQVRRNKQKAMLAKQGLKRKFNDMVQGRGNHARDVETDSEEEAGLSIKRAKTAAAVAKSSANSSGRGSGRARGGRDDGAVGRANRVVMLKGTTGGKKPLSGPVSKESSSEDDVDSQGHPLMESEESEEE